MKFFCIIYLFLVSKSWGQFDGTYTGNSLDGKRVLIKVKTQANIMIGTLYESKSNAQNFFGNIENNEFSAPINFKNKFKTVCIGKFKNDSLYIKIPIDENVLDKYITFSLKKSPKSVDLDKYFFVGEKTNPVVLLGTWKSLDDYNLESKEYTPQTTNKIILGKNGMLTLVSNQINAVSFNQLNPVWYVANDELFFNFLVGNNDMEFGQKYSIKGDTLILYNPKVTSRYLKIR
jgi:hypothetical protein